MAGATARVLAGTLTIAAVVGASFWAGRTTLREPDLAASAPIDSAVVQVVEKEVGRVLTLGVTVTRAATPLAPNSIAGVVTKVRSDAETNPGDVLYIVGRTPVVAVEGAMPFWRDLGPGATGHDVEQLERLLKAEGAALDPDTRWDARTTTAVRAWQKKLGGEQTGVVTLGSLVAVDGLPTSVVLDTDVIWPGAMLNGGELVASVASGEPEFVLEVTSEQASMIPVGTRVVVHGDGVDWESVVTDAKQGAQNVVLTLAAADGGLVCGDGCDALPAGDELSLLSDVNIVEPASGPVVPVSAVTTRADGTTWVTLVDGGADRDVEVEVVTIAQGLAVVSGVTVGDSVKVFGAAAAAPGGGTPAPLEENSTMSGTDEEAG